MWSKITLYADYRQNVCVGAVSYLYIASFPGSSAWAERKEPVTHCLLMLSSPRISGNLEISVKSAPLHQPPQGMPTSPA